MIVLAIDTCEARGGVAIRGNGVTVAALTHPVGVDYSEWLLPAVDHVLCEAGIGMEGVDLLGAATGPGSFTGVRVGLATVKAWTEIHRIAVVGVSRLEAMARGAMGDGNFIAAFYDAQRGQLFAALYRPEPGRWPRVGDELVIPPRGFVQLVSKEAEESPVSWISPDPELLSGLSEWQRRAARGDRMRSSDPQLAAVIAALAEERAARGELSNPLELDANYVRRSDAEIFWRGTSSDAR